VGLKGSDGLAIQEQARALGAVPAASFRALEALEMLRYLQSEIELLTYPGEMGADAARQSGFSHRVIGSIRPGKTTGEDTQRAAQDMLQAGVDLVLFAGGDGTARDIYMAVGTGLPVLGLPAGVKIHSAVYAANPRQAGELAALFLSGKRIHLREAEVMDLDEGAFRQGNVSARLFGYLSIPYERRMLPGLKTPSPPAEAAAIAAIAIDLIEGFETDCTYILGPGTTPRGVTERLGLPKTLLGVDVIRNFRLAAADVNESGLLKMLENHTAKIIVTPIGGQGFIFGRGNQQISPVVIRVVGVENILILSTADKLNALNGRPLLVDTGDLAVDRLLQGYRRVLVGYGETMMYTVSI
jgi:predicted polyphosphate/ATP-dependent NAD kinase